MTNTITVRVVAPPFHAHIDPTSVTAEREWLPVIGPTAWCLARRLNIEGDRSWSWAELGAAVGVSASIAQRSVHRLVMFRLAQPSLTEPGTVELFTSWRAPKARLNVEVPA